MTAMAEKIDHTLLKPQATREQITKLCNEAIEYKFKAVCVNPCQVPAAAGLLQGTGVTVCTVIGFPLGANTTKIKCAEAAQAVADGAGEVDMVINIGAVKDGNWEYVQSDIAAVVQTVKGKALVKVILETCLLTDEEKRQACRACVAAQADFVKTSTGFAGGGATVEDVRLMRECVGQAIRIKASGGIGSYETAAAMVKAGADRLGTSSGVAIMRGMTSDSQY
ncbi:deoc/fbab/ lacd aldolase [Lucifera butyrica]|uniref:Deoxyribose-phosphate aldolase n=1 Tax=Lucifera butyrica TaxID=1351585 RepID=A0A498R845_9FIRM|nr:deoxyribose-phosphate aldolase [Lucifera butyrica]VBB07090.1 deoc/fbab/ lacd aldolase [Lucifera butyrica]